MFEQEPPPSQALLVLLSCLAGWSEVVLAHGVRDTENEFRDSVIMDGKGRRVKSQQIFDSYNQDDYSPRDSTIIKAADDLVAFVEAHEAIRNGCAHEELVEAKVELRKMYRNVQTGNLDLGRIYADFE